MDAMINHGLDINSVDGISSRDDDLELNQGEFHQLRSFMNDHVRHAMTTSVHFDAHERLLWAGSQFGHVTSYYGTNCLKYTAFQAHHTEVKQMLSDPYGILTLAPNQVRYTTKQGLKIFAAEDQSMTNMHCMLRDEMQHSSYVLIAGEQEHFYELDLTNGEVYPKVEVVVEPDTVFIKYQGPFLVCGQACGQVILRDRNTLQPVHKLDAHSASLSSLDAESNLLVTCGLSTRFGHLSPDPYLMVYDLRTLRAFPPAQVPIEPYLVKFMPTYTLRCMVVSQAGQFLLCQPDSLIVDPTIYQLSNGGACLMDSCVSSTYECLAFGDASGFVHVWADRSEDQVLFNHSEMQTVFADQLHPLPAFDIDDWTVPLSSIPMPSCQLGEPLLSDWPEHLLRRADRPAVEIDPDILKNVTVRQFVGYAPNPRKKLRNQVAYNLSSNTSYKTCPESPISRNVSNSVVPKIYRKVDIKYTKYGVESFDFKHYNNTRFSGLEIHIPNAYCNSMLQVLYYQDVIRACMLNHLCQREFCLACELSFLFHMLDVADEHTCQATNFLRAFRTLPEAAALGLVWTDADEMSRLRNVAQTIQNWNRFVLRQLHQDTKSCTGSADVDSNGGPLQETSPATTPVADSENVFNDLVEPQDPQVTKELQAAVERQERKRQKSEQSNASCDSAGAGEAEDKSGRDADCDSKRKEKELALDAVTSGLQDLESSEGLAAGEAKSGSGSEASSVIKDILGMDVVSYRKCKCGSTTSRNMTLFSIDLTYPDQKEVYEPIQFATLLQQSVSRKQTTQAWCDQCKKYQPTTQVRKVKSIPDILNINCQLEHAKEHEFWKKQQELVVPGNPTPKSSHASPPKPCRYGKFCNRQGCAFVHFGREGEHLPPTTPTSSDVDTGFSKPAKSWLPLHLEVIHGNAAEEATIRDYELDEDLNEPEGSIYQLVANVCHIRDPTFGGTLVAHILVGSAYHLRKGDVARDQWYVFNDFAITPVSEVDALSFNLDWKVPCVLMYSKRNINNLHNLDARSQIDSSILLADKSLAMRHMRFSRNYTPLNKSEILKEGDVVGVDAEFVTLNQEESEMHRDGTLSTLRPSYMSVARITVVRGWGPLQGVPFIDDYISTSEQVVDYLTKFSGIKPGDLDATMSSKHLTTLKTSYQKLRFLVDSKLIFVGHGLKKDFRVINLVVPRDQVVDTVELFHLPEQRYVSLKFLAWHFLNIKIQAGTHDSAEDAYTALKLYEKYRELLRAGEFIVEEELEILYETGRHYNWQVPD